MVCSMRASPMPAPPAFLVAALVSIYPSLRFRSCRRAVGRMLGDDGQDLIRRPPTRRQLAQTEPVQGVLTLRHLRLARGLIAQEPLHFRGKPCRLDILLPQLGHDRTVE